ncbi:hypothetical protein CLV56_2654 [Mumia flava]|uniref:THUMP-like domain-containing protein n=1 Tax=Mumia flava TaxID=1348852 RepID=A0A0B2BT22_9ACTN|nr:class I SAM-dependent methyltransferase [Mumia flava]PJJ58403.1 hypothetical protein CLV56_2654 [Mumia flava]
MDVATFERLQGDDGRSLIETIRTSAHTDDLALGTALRRAGHSPELVAAAMSQVALRRRAERKLGPDAARMWFTPEALEQATRATVARHRAERLVGCAPGVVIDLGCGIGADLVAFGRAGADVRGIEQDPLRAAMARANIEALGLRATVEEGDATRVVPDPDDTTYVDPARRTARGRTFDPGDFSPPWDFVTGLLTGRGVVKTMPGIAHGAVPDGVEAEWVSDGGDLVEACLWGRPYAGARRRATLLDGDRVATLTEADAVEPVVGEPQDWWYEPDDAVIRAGLVTAVASIVGGCLVDEHIAYVSAPQHVVTPYATAYRVLDELPYREKALRAALRARDVGTLTVKKRGVGVDPTALVKRLGLRGTTTATVVLTRVDGQGRAFLVERTTST